jgi:hypothetical protein
MPERKKSENEKQSTPPTAPVGRVDDVRARLAKIGIDERDVAAAVLWAREITSKA